IATDEGGTVKGIAAVYVRVSTDEQRKSGLSLQDQRETLTALAQREHLEVRVYEDAGRSGETIERPQLQRLLSDVERGDVARVFVIDQSRLSRDDLVAATVRSKLKRAAVPIQTPAGIVDWDAPESVFTASVLALAAALEQQQRTLKSTRTRRA